VSTEEKTELMNRAKFLISRSGYTTMMELAELERGEASSLPHRGQTEQEYLSKYYAKKAGSTPEASTSSSFQRTWRLQRTIKASPR